MNRLKAVVAKVEGAIRDLRDIELYPGKWGVLADLERARAELVAEIEAHGAKEDTP